MRLLNIPGGGVFGYMTAYMFKELDITPSKEFQAFSGTSVGSQLAAAYASGKSGPEVFDYFERAAPEIFHRSFFRKVNPYVRPYGSKYDDEALNRNLKGMLPGKFGAVGFPLIIPAANLARRSPKIFDNMDDTSDLDWPLWEVVRASSAAPTYFSPWQGYIDGGLIANDPVVVAVTALQYKAGIEYDMMEVFTAGTGSRVYNEKDTIWNPMQWVSPILETTLEGGNEMLFHTIADNMPLKRYSYWNKIELPASWEMDDVSLIPEMRKTAISYLPDFAQAYERFMS